MKQSKAERVGLQTYWRQREFASEQPLVALRELRRVNERCRLSVPKFLSINFCHLTNAVADRYHRNASDLATMRFGEASGSLPLPNGSFLVARR